MTKNFSWEKGFDCNFLLSEIAASRSIREAKCSFNSIEYMFWLPVLKSSIRANKVVGPLKATCIEKSVSDPTVTLKNSEEFLERCEKAFDEIKKQGLKKYVMLCHITYQGPKLFTSIKTGNSRIYWQPKSGNKFLSKALASRHSLSSILSARGVPTTADGLTALLVHVDAYNIEHANEQAASAIDQLRGLLNLIANSKRPLNPFFRLSKPHAVNKFQLGPYRTLHKPDGSLAIEMFWYEPRWHHEHKSVEFSGTIENTRKGILKWWRMIQNNPLRENIIDGLLRYCRALDQHDTDAALLGLWGALENLTATQNDKYDVTVSRATQLFKDEPASRQIALHIKLRRNSTVHAAQSPDSDEVDTIILQAEKLVSQIIFFYIKHGRFFLNQNEVKDFLDLTTNHAALIRHRKIVDRFIDFKR